VRVTADVEAAIERCVHFAPLHNPSNLTGIRVARQLFGENKPQFAIFDTAFHRTLSDAAASYAGSRVWIDQGIRRYGFHGTSFRYASGRAAQLLGRIDDPKLRLILCLSRPLTSTCKKILIQIRKTEIRQRSILNWMN
jgi:acetate kinase